MSIKPVRGTHDLFGQDLQKYNEIETVIKDIAKKYNFNQIITPIFESTDLFKKPLGDTSDVVLKEMYSFVDKNNASLTLRPEYTTPMIRAAISNNLLKKLPQKLFGIGPMFRRERPQKGRYRQFNQINFETLGTNDFIADVELINLANDILRKIFPDIKIDLFVNSLGDKNTLVIFKKELILYFEKYKNDLSSESQDKIYNNPMRILDSKNSKDKEININAPKISDFYSNKIKENFLNIQNFLTKNSINYKIDYNLVRGLDYYCNTVFEFKSQDLGSQDTLIGGGRYDGLIKVLGGPDIPGVGWAGGIERMMILMKDSNIREKKIHLILIKENYREYGFKILNLLREKNINIYFDFKYNLKKSLSFANESKANFAIIIGENEVNQNLYTLKNLNNNSQKSVNLDELIKILG